MIDVKPWHELYEDNEKLEGMIHIYQEEIVKLEEENASLKKAVTVLKKKLNYEFEFPFDENCDIINHTTISDDS